jgi:hypothetical protein
MPHRLSVRVLVCACVHKRELRFTRKNSVTDAAAAVPAPRLYRSYIGVPTGVPSPPTREVTGGASESLREDHQEHEVLTDT